MADIERISKELAKRAPTEAEGYKYYDPEKIVPYVFEQLHEGNTLAEICGEDSMPSVSHVMRWIHSNPAWLSSYKEYRKVRAELEFERALDIANKLEDDWKGAKVKIDTIKWWIEKAFQDSIGDKSNEGKSEVHNTLALVESEKWTPARIAKLKQLADEMDDD